MFASKRSSQARAKIRTPARGLEQRLLDAIPGALAWLTLALTLLGAQYAPGLLITAVALLASYVSIRFIFAGIAAAYGLRLIRRWESTDWDTEYARRATGDSLPLNAVHHLVIIPNYQEPEAVLRRALNRLAEQYRAKESIVVALAMEAAESGARAKGERLQAEFRARFAEVIITLHPAGLRGETRCKSANLGWAVKRAVRKLPPSDAVIVTVMDADTLWHPDYFKALTVLYATDPQRDSTYWQAPIRYHANVWTAHPLIRLLHGYSSAWELAYLAAPWWISLPMSSYSLSLRLLERAGFWDPDAIADEWHMVVKSFFRQGGDQRVRAIFLPFLSNATTGDSALRAIVARARQTFRHAWGAKEIGYTLAQMRRNPRVKALPLLLRIAHDNLLAGAGWVILFLGSQLPLLLHPDWARDHALTLPFAVIQIALVMISLLTAAFWWLDRRIRPLRARPWTWREHALELLSLPLMAAITVICVALPVLMAQTWMMAGGSIAFRVTPKS